jgi:hypothetical protein
MPSRPGTPSIALSFGVAVCGSRLSNISSTWLVTARQPSSSLVGSRNSPVLELRARTRPSCLCTTKTALARVARCTRNRMRHDLMAVRRIRGDRESQLGHWLNMVALLSFDCAPCRCLSPDERQAHLTGRSGKMLLIAQLLALLTCANGIPVLAGKIFGRTLAIPVDGNVSFLDGRPLFGPSKTLRGIVLSIVITAAFATLIGLEWKIGALAASMAMLGDLLSSFVKRRLGMLASSQFIGLDQIPESLLPLLACRLLLPVTILDVILVTMIFCVGALALSRVLFKLHIRDRPY